MKKIEDKGDAGVEGKGNHDNGGERRDKGAPPHLSLKLEGVGKYVSDVVLDRDDGGHRCECSCGRRVVWNGVSDAAQMAGIDGETVIRYLPKSFVDWYARLIEDGVQMGLSGKRSGDSNGVIPGAGKVTNDQRWPVKSGHTSGRPEVSGGGSGGGVGQSPIKQEWAIRRRTNVDKTLRSIARELRSSYDGDRVSRVSRKCLGRCKRIGEEGWLFCPNCGGPMGD